MSTQQNDMQDPPELGVEPQPKPKTRKVPFILTAVVAGVIGVGVGSTGASAPAPQSTSGATQTVEVPGPTVTAGDPSQEARIAELSAAGRDAMTKAEAVVTLAGQAIKIAGEGFTAVANGDASTLGQKAEEIKALNPEIQQAVNDYKDAKAHFEGLAK